MRLGRLLRALLAWALMTAPVWAVDMHREFDFAIAPQPLPAALIQFSQQANVQILTAGDQVSAARSPGVNGHYSLEAGLTRILGGTGFAFKVTGDDTISIVRDTEVAEPAPHSADTAEALQEVIVTGSHIRGGATSVSPMIRISQDQIIAAGQTNLGEVVRSIPQNFSGGQNPGIVFAGGGGVANQNATGGSAINLRGLGADATLTLLNNRRLAYDGQGQAVDISLIPVGALDRIEIVADGASAIYGSDAVGGVANVILKKDYDGVAATARVAGATSGGDFQQQYSLVGGSRWSTGGFIVTLDDQDDSEIRKEQRSYTDYLPSPYSLWPSSRAKAAVLSGHQSMGDLVEFELTGLYARRDSTQYQTTLVTDQTQLASEQYTASPTVTFKLPAGWRISINGIYGRDQGVGRFQEFSLSNRALIYNTTNCYCNTLRAGEIDSDGELFQLPGGDIRGAFGAGYRENTFDERFPMSTSNVYGREHSVYAFSELLVPLVSREMHVAAVDGLSLTGAVRDERYGNFGGVTTPKFGILYSPTPDFDLKASWGKSFKMPTLLQVHETSYAELFSAGFFGAGSQPATATAFLNYGGNRDLSPERATSWTASLGLHPQWLPALRADLSFFHIHYTDRVLLPFPNLLVALSDPAYAQFIDMDPSVAQQQALIEHATHFLNMSGRAYDPSTVVAIINDVYTNVAAQNIRGVDAQGSYRLSWGSSGLTFSENASWLESTQKNAPTLPEFNLSGTIYNQPHWRSRLGVAADHGPLTVSAFHNFIGGVLDTTNTPNRHIGAMQTVDFAAVYRWGDDAGFLSDMDIVLSVQNVANQRPPYYSPVYPLSINYDSNNYSAIGRFVSLAVTGKW